MALAVDTTTNLNLIDAAEATTGWTFSGITKTATSTASREGTNCVGGQVPNASFGYAWHTHGSSVNMTTAGNERVYIWVNSVGAGTYAQSGWMVVIGDGTNTRAYRVGGSDVVPFSVKGWYCLMLDTANLPTTFQQVNGAGAPSLTAITQFGFGIYNVVAPSGNALNVFVDVVRYGSGIIVTSTSGDDITFADLAAYDFSSASGRALGIIREIQPGVYGVQGDIILGNTSGGSIDFKDQDSVVVFEDHVEGAGSNTPFKFNGQHSATGTFSLELGVAVSSGDAESGSNGVIFKNANPVSQPVEFNFSDSNIEDVFIYGGTISGLRNASSSLAFSTDATNAPSHHISGVQFSDCVEVNTGITVVRNCAFIGYAGTNGAFYWGAGTDVKNTQFLGNTRAIQMTLATNQIYDNLTFAGNTYDTHLNNGGTDIDIAKNNGSNPTSQISTGGGTITYTSAAVDTTITVKDFNTLALIENARVFLVASDGTGVLPYEEAITASVSGTVATITHTGHGLVAGDIVLIEYGTGGDAVWNRAWDVVSVTDANTYVLTVPTGTPTSPTGLKATGGYFNDLTNASGVVTDTRSFNLAQPVTGWVRYSATSSPFYKQSPINDTISTTLGLNLTVFLIRDD